LHDIGKVGVPDSVLTKPGKLDENEWVIMKTHPIVGAETLREVDRNHPGNAFVRTGIEIAEAHHEKWNGTGYPFGLAGEKIPLVARILALGDVYDALTSRRCYKEAFSPEKSRDIIIKDRDAHFDPDVVDAFLASEDEFSRIRKEFQDSE
jgi:HD-GYP domain-containing protein (c-di-GMP phosphodiesterase class II)